VWVIAAGAVAGASVISFAALRALRRRSATAPADADSLEESAVSTLRRDPRTSGSAIDVAAVAPGIIELTGMVLTQDVAQRAARLLHALPGVKTVINRLDTGSLERHLATNRRRRARGESSLRERQWYGVRVGTGRRRQSPATDPDRPDDTVKRMSRELEVTQRDIADGTAPEPSDGGPRGV
jgi:hypothetical protein